MNLNFQITYSMNEDIFTLKLTKGGVEDTRLEAKDTKQIQGYGQSQGLTFRGQTLSRPRTQRASVLQKKKFFANKNHCFSA